MKDETIKRITGTDKLLSVSRELDALINKLVSDILIIYKDKLLFEDLIYIIPAVWGASQTGELDQTQKDIHQRTIMVADKAISVLSIKDLSEPQKFAVRYLINRTIISSITCLVESAKNGIAGNGNSGEALLRQIKPMGTA